MLAINSATFQKFGCDGKTKCWQFPVSELRELIGNESNSYNSYIYTIVMNKLKFKKKMKLKYLQKYQKNHTYFLSF